MVGYVFFPEVGKLSSSQDTAIKISTSSGTVIGQLAFGFLADFLGRKKVNPFLRLGADFRCTGSN